MKPVVTFDSAAVAVAREPIFGSEAAASISPGQCPACGSGAFESVLDAESWGERRLLISCSRCGLLRFLGQPSTIRSHGFADLVHSSDPVRNPVDRLMSLLRRFALRSKLRFVEGALFRPGSEGYVLDTDGADGTASRILETHDARVLLLSADSREACVALHRQGVFAVAARPSEPPIRKSMFDVVCRLRRFAHEENPVAWFQSAKNLLRPGGRVVLQAYDSASWAFLVTGSSWAGLESASAAYAFRSADIEVMIDYCGLRIVQKSHFFPLLNACIWISSLFQKLDPPRRVMGDVGSPSRRRMWADLAYVILVGALLPLSLIESVCHAGSVMMIEAEPK